MLRVSPDIHDQARARLWRPGKSLAVALAGGSPAARAKPDALTVSKTKEQDPEVWLAQAPGGEVHGTVNEVLRGPAGQDLKRLCRLYGV